MSVLATYNACDQPFSSQNLTSFAVYGITSFFQHLICRILLRLTKKKLSSFSFTIRLIVGQHVFPLQMIRAFHRSSKPFKPMSITSISIHIEFLFLFFAKIFIQSLQLLLAYTPIFLYVGAFLSISSWLMSTIFYI